MNLINYNVYINTKNRINKNDQSSKATFNIRDLINLASKRASYLSCPYMSIPPTFYNVTNQNHFMTFIEDAVPSAVPVSIDISIPNGNYNINNFITALTGAMTAASTNASVYTGSYDTACGKLTISIVGNPLNKTFTWFFLESNKDLKSFMGFNPDYNNLTVPFPAALVPAQPVYSYTSPNSVNFIDSLSAVYLRCNISRSNGSYSTDDNNSSDIMRVIPIYNNGFSQIILDSFEGIPDQKIKLDNFMNNSITFSLTNQNNELIDLQNYDWSMTLLVQYENSIK